ncbi:hypothetical protein B0H67DRAFT_182343 [Lasiosphaeris hirsuta]|uniref:Uncharacterized protein n=1 Tax=Lasiosphaeris hirsuta TaxID=260670 RepID=A0AA40AQW4_9PEZI|nr:hypothetical protein B0H67DRAFT_182343 [Lasiosphaeris hirsuta]
MPRPSSPRRKVCWTKYRVTSAFCRSWLINWARTRDCGMESGGSAREWPSWHVPMAQKRLKQGSWGHRKANLAKQSVIIEGAKRRSLPRITRQLGGSSMMPLTAQVPSHGSHGFSGWAISCLSIKPRRCPMHQLFGHYQGGGTGWQSERHAGRSSIAADFELVVCARLAVFFHFDLGMALLGDLGHFKTGQH